MVVRFLCGVCIVLSAFLFGVEKRSRMAGRVKGLELIRNYFRSVKQYISHVGMSLDDIACEIDHGADTSQFSRILREKTRYSDFATSFSDTLGSMMDSLCLTEEDAAMLCSVAGRIGGMDTEGAVETLALADEQLAFLIDSAKAKCETEGRLAVALWLSFGTVAALILI